MNILLALVPISLALLGLAIGAFVWAVRRGQFDDFETPPLDILADEHDQAPPAQEASPQGCEAPPPALEASRPPREPPPDAD